LQFLGFLLYPRQEGFGISWQLSVLAYHGDAADDWST
jgi:hypothetical protein